MNTRESLGILTAALLLATCGGCGLVVVPRVQHFPGPLREIRVVDGQTGATLRDASVTCEILKHENWMRARAMIIPSEVAAPSEVRRTPAVQRQGDAFVIEPCSMNGSVQWFFPLPLPTGWSLYREHAARITASAAGYHSLCVQYAPETLTEDAGETAAGESAWRFHAGVLQLGLKATPAP
jgi:hypothetical protein